MLDEHTGGSRHHAYKLSLGALMLELGRADVDR